MKNLAFFSCLAVLFVSCGPQSETPPNADSSKPSAPAVGTNSPSVSEDDVAEPKIPVSADKKTLRTMSLNLDNDPEEEQLIFLQTRSNLSLPITMEVADYDTQRKTFYLAWEGELLASASQPFDPRVDSLISPNQLELSVRGVTENGRPCLDIFRLVTPGTGLGLQYVKIFSQASPGTIELDQTAQGFTSVPVVVEESDPQSANPLDTIKTTWEWRFQKSQYEVVRVDHYRRQKQPDSALEKLFAGDNAALEDFLQGPWVKTATEKKELPLILFFDKANKELVFANLSAQEVYHWEQSVRTLRNALYVSGSNDLIPLIKLQMGVSIITGDSVEINAQDNPNWSGTYVKLGESAARALTKTTQEDQAPPKPPKGVYRNDKGDEFDFQFPVIQLTLGDQHYTGSGALQVFGGTTVLEVKVPGIDGKPVLSKAYSYSLSEEATTSRVVRTLRLQEGRLTIQGWEPNSADALRLEQVEVLSAGGAGR